MLKRIPQPPVNPALRDREYHSFWPGFVTSLVGLVLLVCGARHLTGVETKDGSRAWETQLVKAYSSGGLQYATQIAPPPPPKTDDPAALERWAKQNAQAETPTWKVRVDTEASTPCPT
ncbi:MAG TPA: hypothetical protein VNT26_21545 [Candidatus Sulfotelmatobacter sp.]|nr:hypothetical protein [Candidatus Sulfotelmatobacter sp.]